MSIACFHGLQTRSCVICQDVFEREVKESPLTLHCGHTFGSLCLVQWLNTSGGRPKCPICRTTAWKVNPRHKDQVIEDAALLHKVNGEIFDDDHKLTQALIYYKLKTLDRDDVENAEYELSQQQIVDCIIYCIGYYLDIAFETSDIADDGVKYLAILDVLETMTSTVDAGLLSYELELTEAIISVISTSPRLDLSIAQRIDLTEILLVPEGPKANLNGFELVDTVANEAPRLLTLLLGVRRAINNPPNFPLWKPDIEKALKQDTEWGGFDIDLVVKDIRKDPSCPRFVEPFLNRMMTSWGISNIVMQYDEESKKMVFKRDEGE